MAILLDLIRTNQTVIREHAAAIRDSRGQGAAATMAKPEKYNGKDKGEFEAWWRSVKEYFSVHERSFPDDKAKIGFVGALTKSTALEWHQKRGSQIEKLGLVDQWNNYATAIVERFRDPARSLKDYESMKALTYDKDVNEYVTRFQELNHTVDLSGRALQSLVTAAVPEAVIDLIYSRTGHLPAEDADFLDAVVTAGLIYEEKMKNREIARKAKQGKGESTSNSKERSKRDNHKEDTNTSSSRSDPAPAKKAKKNQKRKQQDREDKPSAPTRNKHWNSYKEAIAGVDQADLDKHKASKGCHRCGRQGHNTLECYSGKTEEGKDIPKPPGRISGARPKQKRPAENDEVEDTISRPAKKVKIAAMTEADHPELFPRVVELSDDSDDSDF